jgi:5-deoxy-glucuronate isomerase
VSLHRPHPTLAAGPWACALSPEQAGWTYSGLRVLELAPGGSHAFETGADEVLVLPLRGSCTVRFDGEQADLAGRPDVFAGPTDFAYLPIGGRAEVASSGGGRFALPSARATGTLPFRTVPADKVPVELRGAGSCSRQVNNFCTPDAFEADRLIACEVLTPAGNWSSYPPHKHDEDRPGESVLEEIYYFETRPGGIAYQRVYGGADVLAEVRDGDVVLVPRGWHGPSMAAPGYDLYYLNVMAGPGAEREWLIQDDPAHAWVRDTWRDQPVDARLPFGRTS